MGAVLLFQFDSWTTEKHWFSLAPCPCHYSCCWGQPEPFWTTANGFKKFSCTRSRTVISRLFEMAECCGSSREHGESIKKTILCHYCIVEIIAVLRWWNETKVMEMSRFLMKQVVTPNPNFIWESCFLLINYNNYFFFLLCSFTLSHSFALHLLYKSTFHLSSVGLVVCLCFWLHNTVTQGVFLKELCTKAEESSCSAALLLRWDAFLLLTLLYTFLTSNILWRQ